MSSKVTSSAGGGTETQRLSFNLGKKSFAMFLHFHVPVDIAALDLSLVYLSALPL